MNCSHKLNKIPSSKNYYYEYQEIMNIFIGCDSDYQYGLLQPTHTDCNALMIIVFLDSWNHDARGGYNLELCDLLKTRNIMERNIVAFMLFVKSKLMIDNYNYRIN